MRGADGGGGACGGPGAAAILRATVLLALLAGLGFVGGFVSGLLGIGGGVVMVPLLLYTPPLFGFAPLDMRQVAGITIVQVCAAALLGYLVHRRRRATAPGLVRWMGGGMVLGAGAGGVASSHVTLPVLEAVFAGLALVAGPVLLWPPPADEAGEGLAREFSRALAFVAALVIGLLSGLVGIGGAFLVIPVMVYLLGVPTRTAIGSSLGVTLAAALVAAAAKFQTGQIVLPWAAAVSLGALPGSWAGACTSRRVPARGLRLALAVLVILTAARMLLGLGLPPHPGRPAGGL